MNDKTPPALNMRLGRKYGCRVGISEGGAHRRSSPAQLPCRD
ncbi:hypothetical protein JMJ77_0014572, partial [Colletotrichum scovillei]